MLEFHFWSGKNLPKLDLKLNKKVVVYTENRLKIDHHSFHEKGNPYHFDHHSFHEKGNPYHLPSNFYIMMLMD